MTKHRKLLSLAGGSLLLLAACGGSDTLLLGVESLFGADFAAAFAQDRTDTPRPSDQLSISFDGANGVSSTKDPVEL